MADRANLEIYEGDDYAATVSVSDGGTEPPDLTGYTAQAQIRRGAADSSPVVVVEITATIIPPNIISLSIPASTTAALAERQYSWDLQLTTPEGQIETLLAGYAIVTREVTREAA